MIRKTYLGKTIELVGTSEETIDLYYRTNNASLRPGEVYEITSWCHESNEAKREKEDEEYINSLPF